MDSSNEGAMQATPQQRSLMAGGPIFDNSDLNAQGSAARYNNQRTFTPVAFDLGSTHSMQNSSYLFNGHQQGESSNLALAGVQIGYASGMGHLARRQGQASAAGLGQNSIREQVPYDFGPLSLTQANQTARSVMNSMPGVVGSVGINLNENQQQLEQGSPPIQQSYHTRTHGLLEQAVSSMNMATQKIAELTSTLLQLEAARQERHEELCRNIHMEMEQLSQVVSAFQKREAEEAERTNARINIDLELQQAAVEPADHRFNWMFGHGVAPRVGARATRSQAKFERVKSAVKLNALWFTNNATDAELLPTFIQFNDDPRISLDGQYLKNLLMHIEDARPLFGLALVRVLRKDEAYRDIGPDGNTHYVSYKWANKVVWENGSIDECEKLFREPKTPYAFCGCTKVVAQLRLGEQWAAVSIDLKRSITYFIHPAAAGGQHEQLLSGFIGMLRTLTMAAQSHMSKLSPYTPKDNQWEFEVALKSPITIHPNDTGVAAAFYSIPKDGQFLPVSYETISLAKYTFIHTLMKMCYPSTKQPIRKGWKRPDMKRDRKGKFIAVDYFNDQLPVPSGNAGGSGTDSNAV